MKRGAGLSGFEDLTWNQAPWRTERELVELVNMKWTPGGKFLMPLNRGVVVKERRSIPPRAEGEILRRSTQGVSVVSISMLMVFSNGIFEVLYFVA